MRVKDETYVSIHLIVLLVCAAITFAACGNASEAPEPQVEATEPQVEATEPQAEATEPPSEQPLQHVTLRLAWIHQGPFAPYYLALENGWYEEVGLDVEILEGTGSGPSVQAVASKSDTFALADGTTVMAGVQEGAPVVTVATINQSSPYALVCRQDAGVNEIGDIVGKSVIFPGGSGQALLWPGVLAANGIDPDEVEVVHGEGSAMAPAIIEGTVDCGVQFGPPLIAQITRRSDTEVTAIYFGDVGVNTVSQGIIVHSDTLEEHPDWVEGFVAATLRAHEYATQNIEETMDAAMALAPNLEREIESAVLEETTRLWTVDPDIPMGCSIPADWEFSQDVLIEQDAIGQELPVSEYFTNQYVMADCP